MSQKPTPAGHRDPHAASEEDFGELLRLARQAVNEEERKATFKRAAEVARKEHYEAEPPPSCPDPVADLRRDCLYHLRLLDLLELSPEFMPWGNIAAPIRAFWRRMRDLYQAQKVSKKPPLEPGLINTGGLGGTPPKVDGARKADQVILDWCREAANQGAAPLADAPAAAAPRARAGNSRGGRPRVTAEKANRLMRQALEDTDADTTARVGWTAAEWALYLRCSPSTVTKTATWKSLAPARGRRKARGRE